MLDSFFLIIFFFFLFSFFFLKKEFFENNQILSNSLVISELVFEEPSNSSNEFHKCKIIKSDNYAEILICFLILDQNACAKIYSLSFFQEE